ncbi:hypothetical protein JTE90_006737 [Oedothorax gibbosus]|uniref:Transposable element P transposase-like RNase H domain-containing protein n=1 Tax=Oedothorax gibbosus TaxID=931172 RepID=A0AAV6U9K4_9ARAC|nr:hypothetical protein JTE90_006737 [Oedothorax gibbosus]
MKFSCKPGILHDVLLLMKRNCESLNNSEKVCILSFDEMHIDSRLCYDSSEDQVLGPFSKVQVVLARGIMSPWKQPVYFDFQKNMTTALLTEIIKAIEISGIIVVAIVADIAGSATLLERTWNLPSSFIIPKSI